MSPRYFELADSGLISFGGEDAASFLHAQLTSDVAGLRAPATQYSGYCSPKGRLLATFLLWRLEDEIVLQLPASLRESIQSRLARYVLRAKVRVGDATSRHALFGIAGDGARALLERSLGRVPAVHGVSSDAEVRITTLPGDRHLVLAPAERAQDVRTRLSAVFAACDRDEWTALEVCAGVPVITERTQEQYVPQMVNLELVGGVSFNKGCYPGQEIVARTHYLGRLKQRMYRIRVSGVSEAAIGDALYSEEFGPGQASGTIVCSGRRDEHGIEALAVIQRSSAEGKALRYGSPEGSVVEFLPLPYTLPD